MGINLVDPADVLAGIVYAVHQAWVYPLTLPALLTFAAAGTATLTSRFGKAEPLTPKDES